MSDRWQVTEEPGAPYLAWLARTPRLFDAPRWIPALNALGATPLFAWNTTREFGTLLACFRRGPLRIGVCGFPVAGPPWDRMSAAEAADSAQDLCRLARLDLVRLNHSMQHSMGACAVAARPEAWIEELADFDPGNTRRLRKDLSLARRAGGGGNRVVKGFDPDQAHELYVATVRRHGGGLRYTLDYFRALSAVAPGAKDLHVFSVPGAGGKMLAFAVMAFNGETAFYLHGAASEQGRREGASDLLLESMVADARQSGCARMSLMASPWEQPGLAAFKKKWSDRSGLTVTQDIPGSWAGRLVGRLLKWKSRHDMANAAEWLAREGR